MNTLEILNSLPYAEPFLFVDNLMSVSESGAHGNFTFRKELDFYKGHFTGYPVTPGVILTECCAQIGLVALGIYLLKGQQSKRVMAMSSSEMEFFKAVYPGETVEVFSEKEYFRFGKLKCCVKMINADGQLVCKGIISGMIKIDRDGK